MQTSLDQDDMPDWLIQEVDSALSECWKSGGEDSFTQLMHLVLNENVSGKLVYNSLFTCNVLQQYTAEPKLFLEYTCLLRIQIHRFVFIYIHT